MPRTRAVGLPDTASQENTGLRTAYIVEEALPGGFLEQLDVLRKKLPLDLSRPTCPRRFLSEWEGNPDDPRERHKENGWVSHGIDTAMKGWGLEEEVRVMPWFRFLEYSPFHQGMSKHTDGSNVHPITGQYSVATMLIYLSTCPENTSGTTLFVKGRKLTKREKRKGLPAFEDTVLESFPCKRNTALIFPHSWLHRGDPVGPVSKIALRCELLLGDLGTR
jgi:hypothetical protein